MSAGRGASAVGANVVSGGVEDAGGRPGPAAEPPDIFCAASEASGAVDLARLSGTVATAAAAAAAAIPSVTVGGEWPRRGSRVSCLPRWARRSAGLLPPVSSVAFFGVGVVGAAASSVAATAAASAAASADALAASLTVPENVRGKVGGSFHLGLGKTGRESRLEWGRIARVEGHP